MSTSARSIASKLFGLSRPPALLKIGHPRLRSICPPLPPSDLSSDAVVDAVEAMRAAFSASRSRRSEGPLVGLSAPQVGFSLPVIAYAVPSSESNSTTATKDQHPLKNPSKDSTEETYLVNPVLTVTDPRPPSAWDAEYESCESIPGYNALVKRAASVSVQALDLKGSSITLKASGLLARILQHEVDHLQGILLTDRMEPKSLRHDEVSILALLGMHIKQCLMPYDEQYIGEYEMQTRR